MSTKFGNLTVHNVLENTPSFSHDNDGKTVVLFIDSNTSATVNSVPTYGGQTMTLVQKIVSGTRTVWQYYLADAPSGVNTMTWDMSGAGGINMRSQVISLPGSKNGTPLGVTGQNSGTGTSATATLAGTVATSLILAGLCKQTNQNVTPGTDTTEQDDGQIVATDNRGWLGTEPAGGSVTIDCSWGTSGAFAFNAAEYLAAPIGSQIIIMMSKMREFYRDLKRGIIRPDELRRRHGELARI